MFDDVLCENTMPAGTVFRRQLQLKIGVRRYRPERLQLPWTIGYVKVYPVRHDVSIINCYFSLIIILSRVSQIINGPHPSGRASIAGCRITVNYDIRP
jgi:hypothetical protein